MVDLVVSLVSNVFMPLVSRVGQVIMAKVVGQGPTDQFAALSSSTVSHQHFS